MRLRLPMNIFINTYKGRQENEVHWGFPSFNRAQNQKSQAQNKSQQKDPRVGMYKPFDLGHTHANSSNDCGQNQLHSQKTVNFSEKSHSDMFCSSKNIVVIGKIIFQVTCSRFCVILHIDAFDVGHQWGRCSHFCTFLFFRSWKKNGFGLNQSVFFSCEIVRRQFFSFCEFEIISFRVVEMLVELVNKCAI